MADNAKTTSKRGKGIYLLPNLFTLGALFAGYYAIVVAQRGEFGTAAVAIFFAMLLDTLDGRVARLTNTQTEFGAQLDSLSDMVCFGVAPALVLYSWSLNHLGKLGWLISFIYTACVALRLARFNIRRTVSDKRYFQGLASTPAAGVIAGLLWLASDQHFYGPSISGLVGLLALYLSLAMVSNIPFRSFKDFSLKKNVPFVSIVVVLLVFVFIAIDPPKVLFISFFLYACSGPAIRAWSLLLKKKRHRARGKSKG